MYTSNEVYTDARTGDPISNKNPVLLILKCLENYFAGSLLIKMCSQIYCALQEYFMLSFLHLIQNSTASYDYVEGKPVPFGKPVSG